MRFFDHKLVSSLYEKAELTTRKRSHYWLHSSHQDKVQRLLIAMLKGSIVEPHYHRSQSQWEMFTVLEGEVEITFYNENKEKCSYSLGGTSSIFSVEISPREIHSVICLSDKALLLEIKEGPFDPKNAKQFVVE